MARAFLLLALLAVAFKQGAAIKCYFCNSAMDEHCGDPLNTNEITPSECTVSTAKDFIKKLGNSFSGFAQNIGLGDMFPAGAVSVEMACQKYKKTDSNGKDMVVRTCILADSHGICSDVNSSNEGVFCEQCKTDGCNGAGQLGPFSLFFYLIVPCIVALVMLRS